MFVTTSLVLTLLALLMTLLYLHLTRNFKHWENKNVSFVKPIPFFGNIWKVFTLRQSIGLFVGELYKSTKLPFLGFFVFDQPFLLVRDPEIMKRILVKDFEYFDDRSLIENRKDDEMGSNILFIIKNPDWRQLRIKLTPVFTTGKMRNMLHLMLEATDDLVDYISRVALLENSTDSREVCMKYATDVIASCAFGIHAQCFKYENAEFRVVSRRIFDWNVGRSTQMASYFFAPMLVRLFKMKFLDPFSATFMREVFWKTMNEREKTGSFRGDLIDVLIQIRAQNDDGSSYKLDEDKVVAQAAMFFIAGFETTGSTISFTLYELSLNHAIQDRLRTEIKTVVKKYGHVAYEAIKEMKYLDMVVNETLRKYPVLPFLDRRCTKDYKIPGTDVVIEEGLPVYMSLFGLHNDPQYFPDPDKFDPERFSYEGKKTRPSFTYMPFGEGLHNCIGARFGQLTSKAGLIRILMDFEVELAEDTPVPLKMDRKGLLVAPEGGLNLRFKPHVDDQVV